MKEALMALFETDIESLEDLFSEKLKSIYYMENEIVDNMPALIDAATSKELKQALSNHLEETKGQVKRLEKVFELKGVSPESGNCPTIDALIEEASAGPEEIEAVEILDAVIIASAQEIEHHEISVYGSMVAWAKELGEGDIASILAHTLEEEKATDAKLTKLAEGGVNRMAA
jgi:ferritin-like metal-binding protein YciE